jgi:hypothetical protein
VLCVPQISSADCCSCRLLQLPAPAPAHRTACRYRLLLLLLRLLSPVLMMKLHRGYTAKPHAAESSTSLWLLQQRALTWRMMARRYMRRSLLVCRTLVYTQLACCKPPATHAPASNTQTAAHVEHQGVSAFFANHTLRHISTTLMHSGITTE